MSNATQQPLSLSDVPVVRAGVYRHYNGDFYDVVGVSHDSSNVTNGRWLVLYRNQTDRVPCAREIGEFFELVETPVGVVPRFAWFIVPRTAEHVELRERWLRETAYLSSVHEALHHSLALEILSGRHAESWLAQDLRDTEEPNIMLMALLRRALTRGPDIPVEAQGKIPELRAIWLAWLEKEGIL